jgi:hypothetical protein
VILIFVLVVLWVTSVMGWGLAMTAVMRRIGITSQYEFDVLMPFAGIAVLAGAANLLNFFVPITFPFAVAAVVLGELVLLWHLPRIAPALNKPILLGVGFIWLLAISAAGTKGILNYDSGLYHLPAIRWLTEAPIPIGLANLHNRFAFNSSWFSVSALAAETTGTRAPFYSAVVSEVTIGLFGMAVLYGLYRFIRRGDVSLPTLFLMTSALVGLSPTVFLNLSSPSTDHPAMLYMLVIAYAVMRARRESFAYELAMVALFIGFVTTLKISVAPTILVLPGLLVIAYREEVKIPWKALMVALVGIACLTIVPWVARNILLSGCALYPISATCIRALPWTVTEAHLAEMRGLLAAWARAPGAQTAQVLASHDWFLPWLVELLGSRDFLVPLGFFLIGVGLIVINHKTVRALDGIGNAIVVVVANVAGLVYWFVSAPDLRYGAGWLWTLSLVALAVGVAGQLRNKPAYKRIYNVAAVGAIVVSFFFVVDVRDLYWRRSDFFSGAMLHATPPVPGAESEARRTREGEMVNVVGIQSDQCYWAPLPCTPHFDAGLRVRHDAGGRISFYPAEE